MKKILGISLVAVLAATPLMASAAEGDQVAKINAPAVTSEELETNNLATTSYVKGAYKAAADKIDAVIEDAAIKSNGSYIDAGKSVAHNLTDLDTAVKANSDAIGDTNYEGGSLSAAVSALQTTASALGNNYQAKSDSNVTAEAKTAAGLTDNTYLDAGNGVAANLIKVAGKVKALDDNTTFTSGEVSGNEYLTSTTDIAGNVVNVAEAVETLNGDASTNGSVAHTVAGAISNLNLGNTYQAKTDSTISAEQAAAHALLTQGSGVAGNLVSVAGAVETLNGDASTNGSVAHTVAGAISNLNLGNTYQAKNDSTVTAEQAAAHTSLTQGAGVAANLASVAGVAEGAASGVGTINNKAIKVVSNWSTNAVEQVKIEDLPTYVVTP